MAGARILLLSPHADDIAYSVGGIVALLCARAEIQLMTVFGRSGWTCSQALSEMSLDTVSALRDSEDRAYCVRRGIDFAPFDYPDSFTVGYDDARELTTTPDHDPRTADVVERIGDFVARHPPQVVLAPCGIGGHVDHRIVRTAAQALDGTDVFFYEDIPYSAGLPLAGLNRQLADQNLAPAMTIDIESVVQDKCDDMWSYRSQTTEAAVAAMLMHAGRVGADAARYAERLWCRAN
jgi:LmbE family N-acetylglucosaminyl deacetylase